MYSVLIHTHTTVESELGSQLAYNNHKFKSQYAIRSVATRF